MTLKQELVDLEYGKTGFIYKTSNIEGRDVHNTFWHDVDTKWVSGKIRYEDIQSLQAPVILHKNIGSTKHETVDVYLTYHHINLCYITI